MCVVTLTENMSPVTVCVVTLTDDMSPVTVCVVTLTENMSPVTVCVETLTEDVSPVTVCVLDDTDKPVLGDKAPAHPVDRGARGVGSSWGLLHVRVVSHDGEIHRKT